MLTAWLWPLLSPNKWWYEQSPLAAVIYHQIGSLAVLLNAMRLLAFERPAGPAAAGWRDRLGRVNRWLEKQFDVEAGLHWLLHHWRPVVARRLLARRLRPERADGGGGGRAGGGAPLRPAAAGRPWPGAALVLAVAGGLRDARAARSRLHRRGRLPHDAAGRRQPPVNSWSSAHGDDGVRRCRRRPS